CRPEILGEPQHPPNGGHPDRDRDHSEDEIARTVDDPADCDGQWEQDEAPNEKCLQHGVAKAAFLDLRTCGRLVTTTRTIRPPAPAGRPRYLHTGAGAETKDPALSRSRCFEAFFQPEPGAATAAPASV